MWPSEYGLPALYALFVWWFSTGLILWLDGLPRRTFRWSLLGATVVLAVASYALAQSSHVTTRAGAYVAFTSAIGIWAWNEMSFLLGFVTGPRREACPEGCGGWGHFRHAAETLLHHELAIAASALVVVLLTWGAPNQIGTWTFLALWAMRLSTKLNVFLGVSNLSEEFLPAHLEYLKHFFTRKPMNPLFPLSITAGTVATVLVVRAAIAPEAGSFEAAGYTFLATLLALAVLEHWFLVLPLPSSALWGWGLRTHLPPETGASDGVLILHGRRDDAGAVREQEVAEGGRDG
jgi:putative photosynthetic complex assembly protein 2